MADDKGNYYQIYFTDIRNFFYKKWKRLQIKLLGKYGTCVLRSYEKDGRLPKSHPDDILLTGRIEANPVRGGCVEYWKI